MNDLEALGDNGHAEGGAHYAVSAWHGQVEDGRNDQPDAAATQGTHVAEHELFFAAVTEECDVNDVFADCPWYFGA